MLTLVVALGLLTLGYYVGVSVDRRLGVLERTMLVCPDIQPSAGGAR